MRIEPLLPTFGARVYDLDDVATLSPDELEFVRATLLEKHLLLFRGGDISLDEQLGLCRAMGALVDEKASGQSSWEFTSDAGFVRDGMGYVGGEHTGGFHSDYSYTATPLLGISMYATELVDPAPPTRFLSAVEAWSSLPDGLKARCEGLQVEQTTGTTGKQARRNPSTSNHRATHPVVFTHPVSGTKILFASDHQSRRIVGLPHDESLELLDQLGDHTARSATVYEHAWQLHDLVLWDNLAVRHARSNDGSYAGRRTLRRVAFCLDAWHESFDRWCEDNAKERAVPVGRTSL